MVRRARRLTPVGSGNGQVDGGVRLFVAILLDETVRASLAKVQAELAARCRGVRWVSREQLHVTLKFLGDVPDSRVAAVGQRVAEAAQTTEPFELELGGCGCFPPRGAARIVWAGFREQPQALAKCVEALESNLEREGFAREGRPFSAHVTIGRVRDDASGGGLRAVVAAARLSSVAQTVRSITLMSSVLSPAGPTYSVVHSAVIGQGG